MKVFRSLQTVVMLGLFSLIGCSGTDNPFPAEAHSSVSANRFKAIIDSNTPGTVILDIRTPEEYASGHIKGAVNIDFYQPDFRSKLANLDKALTYLIYCRSGNRTSVAMSLMEKYGFKRVVNLENGIIEWAQNKYTLER